MSLPPGSCPTTILVDIVVKPSVFRVGKKLSHIVLLTSSKHLRDLCVLAHVRSVLLQTHLLVSVFFIARQHTDARIRDSDIAILSVRPSVYPMRYGILSKRLNVLS